MFLAEFRFTPLASGDLHTARGSIFESRLDTFILELARCGLTLEAGANITREGNETVLTVIAQDDEAIDERNMSYDLKKALERLTKQCECMPSFKIVKELSRPAHCECAHPSHFVMQSPPEWEGTPVKCGDCGKSVPLFRLKHSVHEREFEQLLMWRRLRRGCFSAYESGRGPVNSYLSGMAYNVLKSCASDLSLDGRRLANEIERETGIITLYPLFSEYEKKPDKCPQCGGEWRNPYSDAIRFECFCRSCRLVM